MALPMDNSLSVQSFNIETSLDEVTALLLLSCEWLTVFFSLLLTVGFPQIVRSGTITKDIIQGKLVLFDDTHPMYYYSKGV